MHPVVLHRQYLTYRNFAAAGRAARNACDGGPVARAVKAGIRAWKRRKMASTLSGLDDRTLRDIGLDRGMIADVVDGMDDRELRMRPVAK